MRGHNGLIRSLAFKFLSVVDSSRFVISRLVPRVSNLLTAKKDDFFYKKKNSNRSKPSTARAPRERERKGGKEIKNWERELGFLNSVIERIWAYIWAVQFIKSLLLGLVFILVPRIILRSCLFR